MEWFEIHDIIRDIIQLTKDNLVRWKSYDNANLKTFYINLGIGQVTISRQYESLDDEYDYSLEILNESEEVIEGCYTEYEDRIHQHELSELYEVAENSQLKRHETLRSIRDEIAKIKSGDVF